MRKTHALRLFIAHLRVCKNSATISLHDLSNELFISQRAVIKMVKRLESGGIISVIRQPSQTNTYSIIETEASMKLLNEIIKGK
jgi:Mn-dependent DtxR family transcriptional regulator